uniref:Uncharacterized protein n=1 Tax=Spumella elongata TaxID=89044 RepID=A0A7S3GWG4_9STRA|mmetsp:Transcript_22930/g.39637  ORF Transcript_22930/g.39637 Transcript_22930/m.39637 type:complete len:332 (+) Transcript_22930:38-1033(+)|eukprot:CAMPEP_0184982576 /NCGR_PEP_ID=MMETSP1098-20130426/12023_1 /TAXON_ID=89044 /ORGANISM="Spumella elongata, Strain CCAP 955/1" /LENGTH=331 /DNA_ID=CAMNT_0027506297 /DNA_START=20 /DNA_END=1015 /DNA_ORIENTATION=-
MTKTAIVPSVSGVKGIQMLLAFQVYMVVNENKERAKINEIHEKALQLYTEKVDKFLTDNYNGSYPKSIFSLNPEDYDKITKSLLLSTTFTCSKLLDGKTICAKGNECYKVIVNNILPVYNKYLTPAGDIPPGQSIESVLQKTLVKMNEYMMRAKASAVTVTDDNASAVEEGISRVLSAAAALPSEEMVVPFAWPSFLLYGPPCVPLFSRPVAPLLLPHLHTNKAIEGSGSSSSSTSLIKGPFQSATKLIKNKFAAAMDEDGTEERYVAAMEAGNALQKQKLKSEAFATMLTLLDDEPVKQASLKRKYMDFLEQIIGGDVFDNNGTANDEPA